MAEQNDRAFAKILGDLLQRQFQVLLARNVNGIDRLDLGVFRSHFPDYKARGRKPNKKACKAEKILTAGFSALQATAAPLDTATPFGLIRPLGGASSGKVIRR